MHFKNLDLNLLVILDALIEEKSVTRAAERVHVSQPAVSAALAKLRRHTGDELLVKVGRDFMLTPRAQAMAIPLKEILLQIESTVLTGTEFDPAVSEREFKVGMTSYAAEVLLPGLIKRLTYSYPNISCSIQDLHPEILSSIKKGELDCCVTFQQTTIMAPTESIDELSHSYLFSDEWVLVASADNAAVFEGISYAQFCELPYVTTRMGLRLTSYVERILDQQHMRPAPLFSVSSFELAITSVLNSPCVTVVPALLVDERVRPQLKMFKPPFEMPKIEEILVWHSRNDADPGLTWFRELMLDLAPKLSASK